jgi:hypothetical protein
MCGLSNIMIPEIRYIYISYITENWVVPNMTQFCFNFTISYKCIISENYSIHYWYLRHPIFHIGYITKWVLTYDVHLYFKKCGVSLIYREPTWFNYPLKNLLIFMQETITTKLINNSNAFYHQFIAPQMFHIFTETHE